MKNEQDIVYRGASVGSPDIRSELRFEQEQLTRGILFHIVDEGFRINQSTLRRALSKIQQRESPARISVEEWRRMSNLRRLHWLLKAAGITIDVDLY